MTGIELDHRGGNPVFALLALGIVATLVLGLVLMASQVHIEAPQVARKIDQMARCANTGLYYSEVRGTLLILVDMGGEQVGGQIIRFTEHRYSELVPTDKIYEATCFTAHRSYWCGVITRDGYITLANAKWMAGVTGTGLFIALGALVAWLLRRGRQELADAIEDA